MALLLAAAVVNDTIGGEPVVLLADRSSGAVRAFRRGERTFAPGGAGALVDERGESWRVTEEALAPAAPGAASLPRVPAHRSFWFGWFAFYPGTELYSSGASGSR